MIFYTFCIVIVSFSASRAVPKPVDGGVNDARDRFETTLATYDCVFAIFCNSSTRAAVCTRLQVARRVMFRITFLRRTTTTPTSLTHSTHSFIEDADDSLDDDDDTDDDDDERTTKKTKSSSSRHRRVG